MPSRKYTIKDVAHMAGVSKGTVDRVLHKRGNVSAKSRHKVEDVLKKIDFHPNLTARNLKSNKVYRIAVVIPSKEIDPFWKPGYQGIAETNHKYRGFGLSINVLQYHDASSLLQLGQLILNEKPDAVFMAPIFADAGTILQDQFRDQHIVTVLFNNHINRLKNCNFVGQNLEKSGRVAANLIQHLVPEPKKICIVHFDKEAHMGTKEDGFRSYLREQAVGGDIFTAHIRITPNKTYLKEIHDLLSNTEWDAVYNTNSKTYLLADAKAGLKKEFVLIGYDLLEKNRFHLKTGTIQFLIHQKLKEQVILGLQELAEHLLYQKALPIETVLPIDIVTAENAMYYG